MRGSPAATYIPEDRDVNADGDGETTVLDVDIVDPTLPVKEWLNAPPSRLKSTPTLSLVTRFSPTPLSMFTANIPPFSFLVVRVRVNNASPFDW